jgi:hypothetical protein
VYGEGGGLELGYCGLFPSLVKFYRGQSLWSRRTLVLEALGGVRCFGRELNASGPFALCEAQQDGGASTSGITDPVLQV